MVKPVLQRVRWKVRMGVGNVVWDEVNWKVRQGVLWEAWWEVYWRVQQEVRRGAAPGSP